MSDLRLIYEGNGVFRAATHLDYQRAAEEYEQGETLEATLQRPRSVTQNKWFHALCETAHENQRGGERFANWRTLKGWLLVQAGHCTERRTKLPPGTSRSAAVAFGSGMALLMRHSAEYIGLVYDPKTNELIARYPGPMKMHGPNKLSQDDANAIIDKVVSIICHDIIPGADPKLLVANARGRVGVQPRKKAA